MKPNLLSFGTGQTVLKTRLYETSEKHGNVLKTTSTFKDEPPDTLLVLRSYYNHQQGKPLNLPSEYWYAFPCCDAGYRKHKEEIQLRQHQPGRIPIDLDQSVRNEWKPAIIIRARDKEHELNQISICVLKDPFIYHIIWYHTDIIRLFLSERSNAGFGASLKRPRRTTSREEDNRFKPPDLDQDKHQDVHRFIMIKEAPPDATYKSKPTLNTQGKHNLNSNFNVSNPLSFRAGKTDLRTNPFQVGEDDVILTSKATKETQEQEEQLGPGNKKAKKQLEDEENQEKEPEAAHLPFGSIKPKTKEASQYTTFFKTKTRAILSLLIQPPWL